MTDQIVSIADSRVAAVPIADCGEELTDVRDAGLLVDETRGSIQRISDNPFLIRSGVLARLLEAESRLPRGHRLQVKEGWRPISVQGEIYAHHVRLLRAESPGATEESLRHDAARYVAPPDGAPPHSTGGAIDLVVLRGPVPLDLGGGFNEPGERSAMATQDIGPAARRNRGHLAAAMEGAGFVNYPYEWWHWSYGDRYWAFSLGMPTAIYGAR